jgi:hypothetical protein
MGYVVYGLARTVFFGLLGRLPQGEFDHDDDGIDGPPKRRRRRRRPRSERREEQLTGPTGPTPPHST